MSYLCCTQTQGSDANAIIIQLSNFIVFHLKDKDNKHFGNDSRRVCVHVFKVLSSVFACKRYLYQNVFKIAYELAYVLINIYMDMKNSTLIFNNKIF